MGRSKLEMYTDILKVLAQHGPMQLPSIKNQANFKEDLLKQHLDFLIKQGLIEQKVLEENNVVYVNTNRGKNIAIYFEQQNKPLTVEGKQDVLVGSYRKQDLIQSEKSHTTKDFTVVI